MLLFNDDEMIIITKDNSEYIVSISKVIEDDE